MLNKKFLQGLLVLTLSISFLLPAHGGIKSRCRKTVRKLKRKVNRTKNKIKNYKRKLTNVERLIKNAKRKVNRMPASSRKRKLYRAILNAAARAVRLAKYYMKVKTYHVYVAKRVRKAAKPTWPRKWWRRIKKARKVTNRLVSLVRQVPARIRDIAGLTRDANTIIRNASAIAD